MKKKKLTARRRPKALATMGLVAGLTAVLSGCAAIITTDGNCQTVQGPDMPSVALKNPLETPTNSVLDFFTGPTEMENPPSYSIADSEVQEIFAARQLIVDGGDGLQSMNLTVDNVPPFDSDSRPASQDVVRDGSGFIQSFSLDLTPALGTLPLIGLFADEPNLSIPAFLPVQIYTLCNDGAQSQIQQILDASGDQVDLVDSNSTTIFPGLNRESIDITWSGGELFADVTPTAGYSVVGTSAAIIPWYASFGSITGDDRNDFTLALSAFVGLTAYAEQSSDEAMDALLGLMDTVEGSGPFDFSFPSSDLTPSGTQAAVESFSLDSNLGSVTGLFAAVMTFQLSEDGESLDMVYNFARISGQVQSQVVGPLTTWVPATSQIPQVGSRVEFTLEDGDYIGSATVRSVAADYPFICYMDVDSCIAENEALGFGIVFEDDFQIEGFVVGEGPSSFPGPFVIDLSIAETADFYDSVFAAPAAPYNEDALYGLWVPAQVDVTDVTSVFHDWNGQAFDVIDVIPDTEYVCPNLFDEAACANMPDGMGTFLVFYDDPTEEQLSLYEDEIEYFFITYEGPFDPGMILVGGRAQMQTDFDLGRPWCEARHGIQDGEVFLGGDYIELGVSETGSFGTLGPRPDFMRGTDADLGDRVGMGADLDGYCIGTDLPIDFFLPGDPEERWSLGFNEAGQEPRYISYAPVMDYSAQEEVRYYMASDPALSMFGTTEDVSSADRLRSRTTVEIFDGEERIFEVLITHSFDPADRFYRSEYVVTNTSSDRDFEEVRLMRSVDPDNTVYQNEFPQFEMLVDAPDPFSTRNTILDQVADGGTAQVQATTLEGDPFVDALLAEAGLTTDVPLVFYSNDERAFASTGGFSEPNPYLIQDESWVISSSNDSVPVNDFDPVSEPQPTNFYVDCDCAIQMSADLGLVLASGSADSFTMYTSLDARDFDEVIDEVIQDDQDLNLLFPIRQFTEQNIFNLAPTSILSSGLTNLKINGFDSTAFAGLDPEEKAKAGMFGSFSDAQQFIGLDSGLVINPGYRADAFGYESQGDSADEWFFDPENAEAYVGGGSNTIGYYAESPEDSPIGALAQAIALDSSVPVNVEDDFLFEPTSVSFSMAAQDRYLKLDFVLGTTETAEFNPETGLWTGYVTEYPDAVGIFIKEDGASWLDASNCAAIPTTNSVLSLFNTRILPPGSPTESRPIAQENYNNLVAITAKEGYQLNPNSYVDLTLTEDQAPLIAPPGIAISNRQLGSVVKFVTVPMTCVVDLEELGLESDQIEVGIAIANLRDRVLPPALFVSANSIRFSSNQIAAPEVQVSLIEEIAEALPEIVLEDNPEEASPVAPYLGPVVTSARQVLSGLSASIVLDGSNLESVNKIQVGRQACGLTQASDNQVTCKLSEPLESGVYSVTLTSSFGVSTHQQILTVSSGPLAQLDPTDLRIKEFDGGVKVYITDPVGIGKIQILVDGKEKYWVRATSKSDPKLRDGYFVRTVPLDAGQELTVVVDGAVVGGATGK